MKNGRVYPVKGNSTSHLQTKSIDSLVKLLDSSLDVICSINEEGNFVTVSKACREVLGYEPEELEGTHYLDFVVEEDRGITHLAAEQIMSGINLTNFENRYRRKDGSMVSIVWSARWDEHEKMMYCVARDASEKQQAEKALKKANKNAKEQLKKTNEILESMQDGFFAMDRKWKVTYFNKKAEKLTGKNKEEVIGKDFWEVFPSARNSIGYTHYQKALAENVQVNFEIYSQLFTAWYEVVAYPSRTGLSVYFKDISERKKQEEALHISNQRYELISKATSDALWDWDLLSNDCYFSESFTLLFGYKIKADSIQKIWVENIHEADREKIVNDVQDALQQPHKNHWSGEYRFYRQDGSIAYVLDRGIIIRDNEGKATRMVGSIQDISQIKEAENRIAKSERRFKAMVQSGKDMIVLINEAFEVIYTSDNYRKFTGYTHDELKGSFTHDLVHPDDYEELICHAQQIFTRPVVTLPYFRFQLKNGVYRWYEATLSNHLDNADIAAIVCNVRDVSTKVAAEEELKKLSLVAKETVNAVVITDANERITWVNKAFTKITEYSVEEAIGKKPAELLQGPKTSTKIKAYLQQQISNGLPFKCELINYSKSGREYWIDLKGQPIYNEKGAVEQFFAIQTDITERIELQQMVIDEHLAAQQEVTKAVIETQEKERSEIAKELHDNVNQIIATVKLYLENIRNYPEHRDMFIDKGIGLTEMAINETRNLAHQLVTPVIADLGFRNAIEALLSHYNLLGIFDIDFDFTVCEDKIDKPVCLTIYRIVQESLNNVVKYAKATKVYVGILYEDACVKVMIKDDGIGFDPSEKSHGLGMNNIRNRASLYKGHLSVTSAPGKGCIVNVTFPTSRNKLKKTRADI